MYPPEIVLDNLATVIMTETMTVTVTMKVTVTVAVALPKWEALI